MHIRAYVEADEHAVVALWHACGLVRPWNDPYKDIARKLTIQRELFFIGEVDRRLAATVMAGFDGHRGWVNYLAVSPEFQGRGRGSQLMRHVEQELLDRGCPKVSLLVRTGNTTAINFYRRLGYSTDEAIPLGKRLIPDEPTT